MLGVPHWALEWGVSYKEGVYIGFDIAKRFSLHIIVSSKKKHKIEWVQWDLPMYKI